jgi:hypothetical protein
VKLMSFRTWGVRSAFAVLAALALVLVIPLANTQNTAHAAGKRWTIHGHLVPAVQHFKPLANADGSHALNLSIALSLRDQTGLAQLIADQNNPTSARYHQYLTPQEFAARFSPTQATVNSVTAWLRS